MSSEFITDVINVPQLIGFVRERADGDLPYGDIFPPIDVDDVEFELTQVSAFTGEVAKYRSWDTAPPLGTRPGVSIVGGAIPPLGWSYRLNEKDIARLERLRAGVGESVDQRVVNRIFNDAENAGHAVQNRITLAHGDVLTDGVLTLTELGNPEPGSALVANYGSPGGHFVTAGTLWSDTASSTPITNLRTWEATYRSNNSGLNPDAWLMSSEVMANLCLNAQVRNLAMGGSGTSPGIVNETVVRQVVAAAGVNADLIVDDTERPALDGSGTARVISARKIVAVKAGMGATLYGPTATAATLAGNGTIEWADAPGIIAYATRSVRPASIITTAEAIAIPVLRDPNALFVATV